jgi:hypothetical protein
MDYPDAPGNDGKAKRNRPKKEQAQKGTGFGRIQSLPFFWGGESSYKTCFIKGSGPSSLRLYAFWERTYSITVVCPFFMELVFL